MEEVKCLKIIYNWDTHVKAYRLQDCNGNIRDVEPDVLKAVMIKGKIKVKNMYISPIGELCMGVLKNTYDNNNINKYKAYEMFVYKEKTLGIKMFDFLVEGTKENPKIYITRYHDELDRKEVFIPSFVDGFKTWRADSWEYGVFTKCRYVNKVIMGDNVKGNLKMLFYDFQGSTLDLTEFNTINIKSMEQMFESCKSWSVKLGNKFNTKNVVNMKYMFKSSSIDNLDLGDNFDTSNVKYMFQMFRFFKGKPLDFGDKFNTSNVINMEQMFLSYVPDVISLGNNFYLTNVETMDSMFCYCESSYIDLGKNFDTSNVTNFRYMFGSCKVLALNLGNKFTVDNKMANIDGILSEIKSKEIIVGKDVSELTINKLKNRTVVPIRVSKR